MSEVVKIMGRTDQGAGMEEFGGADLLLGNLFVGKDRARQMDKCLKDDDDLLDVLIG